MNPIAERKAAAAAYDEANQQQRYSEGDNSSGEQSH